MTRMAHVAMRSASTVGTLALLLMLALATCTQAHVHTTPFEIGDEIKMECRRNLTAFPQAFTGRLPPRPVVPAAAGGHGGPVVDDTETWGPGIVCSETGRELSFTFGNDGFIHCGWLLANEDTYNFARSVMSQESGWNCRIPMSKDKSFYLPQVLPLWGVVEATHLHLNYHMAFIFHVDDGRIIGVSSYPVRDRFQFGRVGSMINLHGPVKWFQKHSYLSVSGAPPSEASSVGDGTGFLGVMLWCMLSMLVTFTLSALLYVVRLKPMLVKRYLKGD